MDHLDKAAAQLEDELGALAARVGAVLGTDVQLMLTDRAQDRARWLVAQIAEGDQVDATADLLTLLWPDEPPLDWWRTPLGLLVAPTAALGSDEPGWSRAEAAQVLGVSPGTVAQLVARGSLTQKADSSISYRSVLDRLTRLAAKTAAGKSASDGAA